MKIWLDAWRNWEGHTWLVVGAIVIGIYKWIGGDIDWTTLIGIWLFIVFILAGSLWHNYKFHREWDSS